MEWCGFGKNKEVRIRQWKKQRIGKRKMKSHRDAKLRKRIMQTTGREQEDFLLLLEGFAQDLAKRSERLLLQYDIVAGL